MLQPRLNVCGRMYLRSVVLYALLLSSALVACQDLNPDEEIESSRIKREGVPENRDLTVLLVNQKRNDYNTKIGRYHSVKPLIGLLTSTARTFIQDGVTTEFATQILGTTLDNGRIYAQLLTKSSLVLYNKPSNVEDTVVVKSTRVHSAFDGQWSVKQNLGFIDENEKFLLKNTDYLAPSTKMNIVYASKPANEIHKYWNSPPLPESHYENIILEEPVARRVQPVKEIPRYSQHEAFNYLDGPYIDTDQKREFIIEPSIVNNLKIINRQSKAYGSANETLNLERRPVDDNIDETNIVKVKPNYDLPTFTVKNEFSPIFYYIDNVESRRVQPQVGQQTKIPKKLFGQKSEPRPKKTFTYAGFADFTTVVGDTVIIFTPNTETNKLRNPDEVNVFPSAKRVDKLATKITFLASDIPVPTSTLKIHEGPVAPTVAVLDGDNRSEKALFNDEESLKKVLYEVDNKVPDAISVQYNNGFDFNVDVIQPSESAVTTTESTHVVEELGVLPIQDYSSRATEPLTSLSPTSTVLEIHRESAVTDRDATEIFTNSEEESENTAAEVTERSEEENEDEEVTTEIPKEIMTVTESGHSEESFEDFETTTESKFILTESQEDHNVDVQEETFCTEGLETQSTMTTAYNTLTYLTTYFIPIENTETSTSIKSDVVVESNVGYLTNIVCRTNLNIEPTAVVNVDVNYSMQTKVKTPQVAPKAIFSRPSVDTKSTTEASKTTQQEEFDLTTQGERNTEGNIKDESVEVVQDKESETPSTVLTTTTERIDTNVEVSVSTEHVTVSTEKSTSPAPTTEEIEDHENEIDVIYKTLYTTYTYFTTFFGDQTSSVASHKSVITNIITSTIDLSKLDPSLLGAFSENEIAPTGVGVGRPTESLYRNSIIDLVQNKEVIESVEVDNIYNSQTPTPSLGDIVASIKPDAVKTYFTTYTFFTTIYVGTDANVCSRNEVYTNYVGPDELIPTKANPLAVTNTRAQFDFRNCKQIKMARPEYQEDTTSMESSVSVEEDVVHPHEDIKSDISPHPTPIEVDMLFSVESNPLESENSYVTDIKSSSSKGERKFLENNHIVLDDQISSESNIEEILPSPTLLLQTSYTTFTYFTTMYIGKDSSKVKSRLETITNVVTETIMPNKEPEEESNLPITYYTTFTYWTTLYKDKSTTITSREEIVSNIVTPVPQAVATISPIDTTPIDIDSVLPPKDIDLELKPSLITDNIDQDDGKATFYTTYTYFTTFYTGNTSQIRSSLQTVTSVANIADNSKLIEDNQLGRKVPVGPADQNLIQDGKEKSFINPTVVKEEIIPTKLPEGTTPPSTVLLGTYIDNLFAEVKPEEKSTTVVPENEKKIIFSQVAVISGDSTIVTSDNKTLPTNTNGTVISAATTTEGSIIGPTPQVIESSVGEPEITTENAHQSEEEQEEEANSNTRKKSRLTFTPKKPSTTPVIIPFASRNRPTFIPKRVPLASGATTITRADFKPPVITATPSLKSVKSSGYNGNRKLPAFSGSSNAGKRFSGRSSSSGNFGGNIPSASRSGGFGQRASIQPTSRRSGFRSSSVRANSLDYVSRTNGPRIRPTASSRFPSGRNVRPSASVTFSPQDQNDETLATQQDENFTEALEEITEATVRTTNNPLLRFRRPPIARQPGTAIIPRSTTSSSRRVTSRGRLTTTTKRSTTRSTQNPLLSLRRQRPNALFPRRNLFKQPEPEPEEEIKEDEQKVENSEELLDEEEFDEDNDYDSSDRKERQVPTPSTTTTKKNIVQIKPFAFRRRTKRQVDYGNRKFSNFRRPGTKAVTTRRPEPETEPPTTPKPRPGRFNNRANSRTTTVSSPKSAARQPFIVRGETRTTTTTSAPAYRRGKSSRPTSSRTTTTASRPKPPRLNKNLSGARSSTSRSSNSGRSSRPRTTTSRASSRQRNSFENFSGERYNYKNYLDDGKITITHQIPTEITIPIVNGKITEYKNLLSATPSLETILNNQVSTSFGPLGNPQLVLAVESTELADNGATKLIKYLLHETPTTTVIFTPTTIRGRKTSFSHILPSTVYNVEPVTQTIAPEINANVPLANLLLSQLLLGGQQPGINPLLALQGQGLIPQQPVAQTPVTEFKTRTTTYVTTVVDARETVLPITFRAFNTHGIVYDNTPWRPGRDMDLVEKETEDERKLNNLATRVMSNGVEVLVKEKNSQGKNEQTKYMDVKTIHPSAATKIFMSNNPKIDKRIDSEENDNFDLIQPSEVSIPCTSSCSCSNTKTESLKTKYTESGSSSKYGMKTTKYGATKLDLNPTNKESLDKKTQFEPYEFESNSQVAPTDKIVEKYTEVINDYSDEKESNSVEESELLTNEQAPVPPKTNKVITKVPDKSKPEKHQKPNKNKFVVADLLKLGSLGIKGLSQLAPVFEKMTGGFIRRYDTANKTSTTTIKPVPAAKITPYNANKRVDNDMEAKHSSFPIYIPIDEMETSESQLVFSNATLHQNLAWAVEHKNPKAHIVLPKVIHESPLVNGGIPISPGEIITANSDVIVGKPAVGGSLTLAASGIKLQNTINPPLDSFVAANEQYFVNEEPLNDQPVLPSKVDDSFDLRPPEPPKHKVKSNRPIFRPGSSFTKQNMPPNDQYPYRMPSTKHDHLIKNEQMTSAGTILGNHGRPVFLDYIPSLVKPGITSTKHHKDRSKLTRNPNLEADIADSSPSSSDVVHMQIRTDGDKTGSDNTESNKQFLVDIQPSRVANVLIPHGSSTALVFAGSSEPHKTGDYIDDPLPYPEPGYFGTFSIDAPQMTNVHNVAPGSNKHFVGQPFKEQSIRNENKLKWEDSKRPSDFNKVPAPTSNQETHVQIGPQITVYDPEVYNPTNNDFQKFHQFNTKDKTKGGKDYIDKDYENYLAVPPPPPSKQELVKDIYDNSKPYSHRPIVHTKPVQDMKVFLNVQHPVPDQLPPKVTSEIYFASQITNNKPTPTYTIRMPSSPFDNYNHQSSNNLHPPKIINGIPSFENDQTFQNNNDLHNSFSVISSPNVVNPTPTPHESADKNTYTVTLNTATNVASNNEVSQVVGSSVPVPVGSLVNVGQLNTNIPISTNFAIKVEDNTTPLENYDLHQQGMRNPYKVHNQHDYTLRNNSVSHISIGDNRWNKSSTETIQTTTTRNSYYDQNYGDKTVIHPVPPSVNSHANFPMINDYAIPPGAVQDNKYVTTYEDNSKTIDVKRPAKLMPNIPTNSHGWYSSVLKQDNINNIKVEATTRKIIPLIRDFSDKNRNPHFGQKISSVGKPPSEFWNQNAPSVFHIGKPFTKSQTTEMTLSTSPPFNKPTTKQFNVNYIPSNFDNVKQPAYNIPVRDNSDETTTSKSKITLEKEKPIYENSEEIYDGGEETESAGDLDGEVSSESMKVPIVSSSKELENFSKSSTEITLLQDEVYIPAKNVEKNENENKVFVNFNPGTQTEKPFGAYNQSAFQLNTVRPTFERGNNNIFMKPRPFTVNTAMVLDHQLQQPHWQINHMIENSTNVSSEDNIDLNIGEEIEKVSSEKPLSTLNPIYTTQSQLKDKKPLRPNQGHRLSNSHIYNESIITSTVQIQDKKPLIIEKVTEKTPLPTFTLPNLELNRSSSEIIDLSPPPPTMDYSFKPSTNDEMIMGMSPPPPRPSAGIRIPTRVPLTPRPIIPPRTPPSYRTKSPRPFVSRGTTQRPIRKPINRDEVSTYRPHFDILSGIRRPTFNRDQPSSQLLPPPRESFTKIVNPVNEFSSSIISVPKVVFPTPISSGWLTSSGIGFSSSINFAPTSIQFPEISPSSKLPDFKEVTSSESSSYESSIEDVDESSSEKSITENRVTVTNKSNPDVISFITTDKISTVKKDTNLKWSSNEEPTTDGNKVIPIGNKNRTRKPYPVHRDENKNSSVKLQLSTKHTPIIKPTKTLSRPDILYPTRSVPFKKIDRPISRPPTIIVSSVIESSEQAIDEKLVKPTEVLKDDVITSVTHVDITRLEEPKLSDLPTPVIDKVNTMQPVHHAGNEIKISDDIVPIKTEVRTTVVTLTKTLSEPPRTVSSIGYVNLTHTLTVTHTETSLVSQSEGAITQTLVLTNTHTSTVVDVVTEVYTQVQPTTIIETVTKHIPIPQVQPTPVLEVVPKTKIPLDDISMSSEENENLIIRDSNKIQGNIIQKIDADSENETDNDTFFVVMNKSQNGGQSPPVNTEVDTSDYDVTRNEQVNNNGVSQVLFGEILLAGTPYLETTNVNPNGGYGKECQPDCKASRNERCQRIDGIMKCVCRPGFARMFPDRPCKPTYTYSVKLALGSQGNDRLEYHNHLSDNSSKIYHALALATHEGINRMIMQSDLRDVYHGVHITGFHPVQLKSPSGDPYEGVMNDFYVQLSDNAHESRLKEVIEKYLRNNNYSLGGTEVHAASELMDKLDVSDFDECVSGQFHDCSEHAQCFNLRGTYTCSCLEGFADLSVNTLYPGRICSAEPVGCERCNYHGACYSRDDRRVLCECFQWYAGSACQINLKVVLISLVVCGALLSAVLAVCAVLACSKRTRRPPHPQRSIVACIQGMPSIHQGAVPKQRADRRALISERGEPGDTSSLQNASLPYIPAKQHRTSTGKKCVISDPPAHDPPPPPPAPAVMIPRARLNPHHGDSRENIARKRSLELCSEAKLISYLESGATNNNDEMRRKHSLESSYSANRERHNKQGALVSAGFKVSTTIRPDEAMIKSERDDVSSVNKGDLEAELSRFDTLRKSYSQEDLSEWTDAERRLGELTLSEARSVGGTLPASTGRAASSTRLTHQEANTMAERDLGSTFLLPHVHLYKPDLTSDVSEFDSL